jgi:hypothetical protein
MKKNKKNIKREVTLEGMMTFGMLETGLRALDFECCEDVEMEQFITKCKVQGMRDGNVYLTELPKRTKNKPIFRDDNCSFSHGKDGRYYFYFSLDDDHIGELPELLVRQASAIAQKIIRELICN